MPVSDTIPETGGAGAGSSGDAAGEDVTTSPTNLRRLLPALAEEPTLAAQVGRRDAVLAVPTAARAFVIAGMAEASERRPLVVCTSTNVEAESLAADISSILGADEVDIFPAWETLPFERVSPGVETMGRRMRTRHRLESPDRCPAVLVAPTRALVQRLLPGPAPSPVVVGQGDQIDAVRLVEDLVGLGYRREPMVEHRGEIAVRGSIVDVFPSTTDAPVRIDLWGDDVDRLTEFSVGNQRATVPIVEIELYPCRESYESFVEMSDRHCAKLSGERRCVRDRVCGILLDFVFLSVF